MSVLEGIAAVKASLDVAKLISDRLNRPDIDVADVRAKVHEMLVQMVNAQVALGEARTEIDELRRQLEDREASKALEADLEFTEDGGFWLRKSDKERNIHIPYCPVCWGESHKLIPLTQTAPDFYECSIHYQRHETTAYKDRTKARNAQLHRRPGQNWRG